MSLEQQIPMLLEYVQKNARTIDHNSVLFDIYEGDLYTHLEKAMSKQFSREYFDQVKHRACPINVLRKIVDKLSRIYQQPVARDVAGGKPLDAELLQWYEDTLNINQKFNTFNEFYNLFKNSLIQPYIKDGVPKIRVIPSERFLPFSDDLVEPSVPTHFIVFMGDRQTAPGVKSKLYAAYTAEEFLIFDSDEKIQRDRMFQLGNIDGINTYGRLPFVYVNQSEHLIIPKADSDQLAMTIVLPLMLSDLNASVMFQAFSLIYGINVSAQNLVMAPNAFWELKSETGDPDQKPEIGQLKPQVDIPQVLDLVKQELAFWLDTKGIKAGSVGDLDSGNLASGISKMIDEADTSDLRKEQQETFHNAEMDFWDLQLNYMHPVWVENGLIENRAIFTPSATVETHYVEPVPIYNRGQLVRDLKDEMSAGFISRRDAIKRLNPHMNDEAVDKMIMEIDADRTIDMPEEQPKVEENTEETV